MSREKKGFQDISQRLSFLNGLFVWNGLWFTLMLLAFLPGTLVTQLGAWWYTVAFVGFVQLGLFGLIYLPLTYLSSFRTYRLILLLEGVRVFLLVYDFLVFKRLGIHLYDPLVVANAHFFSFFRDIGVSASMVFVTVALFVGSMSVQWFYLFLWRRQRVALSTKKEESEEQEERESLPSTAWSLRVVSPVVLVMGVSLVGFLGTPKQRSLELRMYLPLYKLVREQLSVSFGSGALVMRHLSKRKKHLQYPAFSLKSLHTKKVRRPDIVMWSVESLRADMLNHADMPKVFARLKRPGTLLSQNHYAGSHISQEGVFSLVYSLYSNHYKTFYRKPLPPATLQILRRLGYELIALTGVTIRYPGYEAMLKPFHKVEDYGTMHPLKADQKVFARAQEIIRKRRSQKETKPLFLFLTCNSTHHPYAFTEQDKAFLPIVPERYDQLFTEDHFRLKLWNRYRNASRFLDRKVDELLTLLEPQLRAGQLIWSFVGDHGETFWDHGLFGHGPHLNNATTQTPFALYLPGEASRTHKLSSHVDIFPTIFDWMGVSLPAKAYSDGTSLRTSTARKYVVVNANHFPFQSNAMVVTPRHKVILRRTDLFQLEVNRVLGLDDREAKWSKKDIAPALQDWMQKIDRFTPGYSFWRYKSFRTRLIPHHPFVVNKGAIRTATHPELRPWERNGQLKEFVSTKRPHIQYKRHIELGKSVVLVGFNIYQKRIRLGSSFSLELIFYCRKPPPKSPWRFFFHLDLMQAPGLILLRGAPVSNQYPLWKWKPGEYIRDVRIIKAPNSWQIGSGYIRVGIVNPKTHKRVKLPLKWGARNSAKVMKLRFVR